LTFNSASMPVGPLNVPGIPVGQLPPACFGVTDDVFAGLLATYGPGCAAVNLTGTPPTPTPCVPVQILMFTAASLQAFVVGNVSSYLRGQASAIAAASVPAPSVTTLPPP
jgi:hypothetical protein